MKSPRSAVLLFAGLAFSLGPGCASQIVVSGCDPISCALDCPNGLASGADGCPICACAGSCSPVGCDLYCEYGYETSPEGCPICACVPPPCAEPSPAGCTQTGCPSDSVCDPTVGCFPSACTCDPSGAWSCTKDCQGGTCVPVAACGENPAGCVATGCPDGQVCDPSLGCNSSGCECDPSTGSWVCLPDCGGGVCKPSPEGCSTPDPTGCKLTGCPNGAECIPTSGVCVPSWCTCDPATGGWTCSMDCDGGFCATLGG